MTNGQWHGGKGSSSRPLSVTQEEYANRWDLIFGRDKAKIEEQEPEPVDPFAQNDFSQGSIDEMPIENQ